MHTCAGCEYTGQPRVSRPSGGSSGPPLKQWYVLHVPTAKAASSTRLEAQWQRCSGALCAGHCCDTGAHAPTPSMRCHRPLTCSHRGTGLASHLRPYLSRRPAARAALSRSAWQTGLRLACTVGYVLSRSKCGRDGSIRCNLAAVRFWFDVQSTPRCVMRLLCSPFMPPMGHRYLQVGKSDITGWQIRHYGQDHAMRLDGQLNNAQQLC